MSEIDTSKEAIERSLVFLHEEGHWLTEGRMRSLAAERDAATERAEKAEEMYDCEAEALENMTRAMSARVAALEGALRDMLQQYGNMEDGRGETPPEIIQARAALSAPPAPAVSQAADDVLAERRRQVEVEGWTPEHDDRWRKQELCYAAGSYLLSACDPAPTEDPKGFWPWSKKWWKPTTPRRDLVKAGALIIAEIERRDRGEG